MTWALAGDDAGLFTISNAGVLAFNDSPDYETPLDDDEDNVYRVTVQATDASDITGVLEIAITVTDVDDGGVASGYDLNKERGDRQGRGPAGGGRLFCRPHHQG